MVEGAQIDWASHNNVIENVIREVLDFDKAVEEALKFADKNGETLVIITADHETGGMSLSNGNIEKDILKLTSQPADIVLLWFRYMHTGHKLNYSEEYRTILRFFLKYYLHYK